MSTTMLEDNGLLGMPLPFLEAFDGVGRTLARAYG